MEKEQRLDEIRQQLALIDALVENVPGLVRAARMSGATWEQIGDALGVTKQRAHQLYAGKMGYEFPLGSDS